MSTTSWRPLPRVLRRREFRMFWLAKTTSLFGDEILMLVLPLAAVGLHADAAQMGYLTAVGWLPNLLFALSAGAWVDGKRRKRLIMIVADLGRAAVLVSIPVGYAVGVLALPQLYAAAFTVGVLEVFYAVSQNTLFVALLPERDYVSGSAWVNGSRAASEVGGQSIGGLLVAALTAPVAIAADAFSFLVSALCLARIRPEEPPATPRERGHLAGGIRFIRRSAVIRTALSATATVNFFTFVFQAIFVLYATTALRVSAGVLGLVLGAGALGGVLGAAITTRVARRIGVGLTFTAGCLLFPAPLLLVPLADGSGTTVLILLFLAEFGAGVGVMLLDIAGGTIQAAVIPDAVRARTMGAFRMVNYGTRPLGALTGGWLGSAIGLHPTLWIATIGGLTCVLWLLPSPIPRRREFRVDAAP